LQSNIFATYKQKSWAAHTRWILPPGFRHMIIYPDEVASIYLVFIIPWFILVDSSEDGATTPDM
jgi:hypothetical protein